MSVKFNLFNPLKFTFSNILISDIPFVIKSNSFNFSFKISDNFIFPHDIIDNNFNSFNLIINCLLNLKFSKFKYCNVFKLFIFPNMSGFTFISKLL